MRSDLPDIREMFTAGEGHVFVEGDLKGADAQIVAAEAKDQELLDLFQTGIDIHTRNAGIVYPGIPISATLRQRAKNGVHAVNYGVHERTLSITLNCSQEEALQFISNWFKKHPKIRHWQREIWKQLRQFQEIRNAWGYKRHYFDRIEESLLPKALAWLGQGTIAITINKALKQVEDQIPELEFVLQVHDSLIFRVPSNRVDHYYPLLQKAMAVNIPFQPILQIPVEFSVGSNLSNLEKIK